MRVHRRRVDDSAELRAKMRCCELGSRNLFGVRDSNAAVRNKDLDANERVENISTDMSYGY